MLNFIDKKIRQAFSDAAIQYDVLTSLHKEIGRELMRKINTLEDAKRILDIGMGTGWLTNKLKFYFPDAMVIGMDFALGMIESAKKENEEGVHIVQADAANLPFKDDAFDVIISNLAFQWITDLAKVFVLCQRSLSREGRLVLTMFGYNTFQELFLALGKESGIDKAQFRRLADRESVEAALKESGFNKIKVEEEFIKVHFPMMLDLLKWIKDIGANMLNPGVYLGKDALLKSEEYYNEHFRDRLGIRATFEVLWVEAQK
jgi:malonyl-CoA O-methyltransferase